MATATTKVNRTYTLELNEDEAAVLLKLCRITGGHNKASPRKHVDSVLSALRSVDKDLILEPKASQMLVMSGSESIFFRDYE